MALSLNIHIGHTAQFEILCFNLGRRAMLTLHLENSILRIFLQCQAQPFQTHSHTCQTGQDVLLAAVSEDLRSGQSCIDSHTCTPVTVHSCGHAEMVIKPVLIHMHRHMIHKHTLFTVQYASIRSDSWEKHTLIQKGAGLLGTRRTLNACGSLLRKINPFTEIGEHPPSTLPHTHAHTFR